MTRATTRLRRRATPVVSFGFADRSRTCGGGVPRQAGALLVITLWLITILSVLAVAIGRYLSTDIRLVKYQLAREQAKALARSGVYLGIERLQLDAVHPEADGKSYDWLGDEWAIPPGSDPSDPTAWTITPGRAAQDSSSTATRVIVRMTDDERRLDLNAVSPPVLMRLVQAVGGTPEVAQAIIDYADPDQEPVIEEPPYVPKNAPFAAIEELLEIPAARSLVPRLRSWVSVVPGATALPRVNINTAGREVLLALGADPIVVEALLASRPGIDGVLGTDDDCRATDLAQAAMELAACALQGDTAPMAQLLSLPTATFVVSSSTFRIQAEAVVEPGRVTHWIEAVVHRSADGPRILAWREG